MAAPKKTAHRARRTDLSGATALITGASSGIGLELAREFATHGHPLFLTAPVEAELADIAAHLQEVHHVPVHHFAADLQSDEGVHNLTDQLARGNHVVEVLVNNAGLGQRGEFWNIPLEKDIEMIRVNVEVLIRLTKHFLPGMIVRGRGGILNTASVAGFEPGPLLAVYHATKAFVLSLTEALSIELQDSPVTVTALCPGPTDTDFFPKADMVSTRAFQKAKVMSPQEVARGGYEALLRGDRVYVPGATNRVLVFTRRLLTTGMQARKSKALYERVKRVKRRRGDVELRRRPARPSR